MTEKFTCELCGEPMPGGEEMFKFHGYSGPCPAPPLSAAKIKIIGLARDNFDKELENCMALLVIPIMPDEDFDHFSAPKTPANVSKETSERAADLIKRNAE